MIRTILVDLAIPLIIAAAILPIMLIIHWWQIGNHFAAISVSLIAFVETFIILGSIG